jgi:integrase
MRQRFQNGCVRKSKDGRYWVGQWREDGRLRSRVLGKVSKVTKSTAREKLADVVKPINERAAYAPEKDITVKDYVERIYLPFYKRKWKESTAMTNEDRVNHHIVAEFGPHQLRSLTRDDLQRFLDSKSSLSFSTADHLRWDLKQMFDMAVAEGIVRRHPALILFTPRQCARPEHPTLSLKEVKRVFDTLGLRERLIVKLAVLAGMRPGEIFGLKRGRISCSSASIEQRVYRGIIDTPKTHRSKRFAALSSGLRFDLEEWLGQDPDGTPDDWLFPSEKLTTPLAKDNAMYRYIRPALKLMGLDWVDFHVLRRTHASLMRELGVDPKVVADQQGHTLDVNLNVYTETSLEKRVEAVEQLESAFVN